MNKRGRELARIGDELVVGGDLAGDGVVGEHALGARHLLHLEAHGVGVLEHDGDEVAERDAAALLHRDDRGAELVALALVGAVVDDVVDGELPHGRSSLVVRFR